MPRKKHANKHIEAAVQYAESIGWRYKKPGNSAHAWGRLLCPLNSSKGCSLSVWSTPRNPDNHAAQIVQRIEKCTHTEEIKQILITALSLTGIKQ